MCIFKYMSIMQRCSYQLQSFPSVAFSWKCHMSSCVSSCVTVDYVEMQVYGVALDDVDFVLFV